MQMGRWIRTMAYALVVPLAVLLAEGPVAAEEDGSEVAFIGTAPTYIASSPGDTTTGIATTAALTWSLR